MPQNREVVARYRRQLGAYRLRTSALLVATWNRLGSWDRADIERFEAATAAPLAGVKTATVSLSAAFFALYLDEAPPGVDPDRIDITPYTPGPFLAAWHALKQGRPLPEAIQVGASTASAVGYDFVQHVARRTGDYSAAATGRDVRWRRVPGGKACDWCLMVAGDHYRTAESADFGHERDDCIVVPADL
jgi:hypothetical protein